MTIRVVVVDDDYRVAELHARYVRSVDGFDVAGVAHTASTAIELVRSTTPDLVLLDQYLPDRRGTEIVTALGCDVMMLTAAADTATVRAALGHGVVNYLVKPFSDRDLAERLQAYARYRSHLATAATMAQSEIDRAARLLREGDATPAPSRKGRSAHTADVIAALLRDAKAPMSASEIAGRLGIARATAQRYLGDLVDDAQASMSMRYGSAGRPEHLYRWHTPSND